MPHNTELPQTHPRATGSWLLTQLNRHLTSSIREGGALLLGLAKTVYYPSYVWELVVWDGPLPHLFALNFLSPTPLFWIFHKQHTCRRQLLRGIFVFSLMSSKSFLKRPVSFLPKSSRTTSLSNW